MPLRFKVNILESLKEKGYTTYSLRKENILSQSTIQKLREGKGLAWENIERLCALLHCQPGDILEFVEEDKYAKIGLTKGEIPELRKLIQLIPAGREDALLPVLIKLIRTEDWYDLSDMERSERFREVVLKNIPGDK